MKEKLSTIIQGKKQNLLSVREFRSSYAEVFLNVSVMKISTKKFEVEFTVSRSLSGSKQIYYNGLHHLHFHKMLLKFPEHQPLRRLLREYFWEFDLLIGFNGEVTATDCH